MNIKKFLLSGLTVLSLASFTSCDLLESITGGNPIISSSESSESINNKDLQLLRIETGEESGYIGFKSLKREKRNAKKEAESQYITLTAVIKNETRASFIDMVVYDSVSNKTVVYNEGNGQYQCSSETVYEDDMWVTNVTFSMYIDTSTYDDFYIEIKEIKFLKNSVDTKADLNEVDVRKVEFTFSDSFLSRFIEQEIKHDAFREVFVGEVDTNNKTCVIGALLNIETKEDQSVSLNDIVIPDEIDLKYYQNKELKEGKFQISTLKVTGLVDQNGSKMEPSERKIKKIIISDKVEGIFESGLYAETIEYKEGSKVITAYWGRELIIPTTCEEIALYNGNHVEYSQITYKGTMSQFLNIKGAKDYIEVKSINVVCSDGIISEKNYGNGTVIPDSNNNQNDSTYYTCYFDGEVLKFVRS